MTTIGTEDGETLEAQWMAPERPVMALVLCHPHPLHGGTMNAPLMRALGDHLTEEGFAVLRFNFRGVGSSTGSWGAGSGEVRDVAAAAEAAREAHPGIPLGVVGWSFGASTSLRWQIESGSPIPWAGIAPAVRPYAGVDPPRSESAPPGRRLIIVGDHDQFATIDEMERYADSLGAELQVINGSDHFFYFREQRVVELVAGHFLGGAD